MLFDKKKLKNYTNIFKDNNYCCHIHTKRISYPIPLVGSVDRSERARASILNKLITTKHSIHSTGLTRHDVTEIWITRNTRFIRLFFHPFVTTTFLIHNVFDARFDVVWYIYSHEYEFSFMTIYRLYSNKALHCGDNSIILYRYYRRLVFFLLFLCKFIRVFWRKQVSLFFVFRHPFYGNKIQSLRTHKWVESNFLLIMQTFIFNSTCMMFKMYIFTVTRNRNDREGCRFCYLTAALTSSRMNAGEGSMMILFRFPTEIIIDFLFLFSWKITSTQSLVNPSSAFCHSIVDKTTIKH